MSKRTLLFSNPYHLHTRLEQLVVDNKETGEVRTTLTGFQTLSGLAG